MLFAFDDESEFFKNGNVNEQVNANVDHCNVRMLFFYHCFFFLIEKIL